MMHAWGNDLYAEVMRSAQLFIKADVSSEYVYWHPYHKSR